MKINMHVDYDAEHDTVTFSLEKVPRAVFQRILAACGTTLLQEITDGVEAQRVGMDLDIEQTTRMFHLQNGEW